jgi:hypothetical protein
MLTPPRRKRGTGRRTRQRYRIETRGSSQGRGEEVLATGHLSREQPLEVGEWIVIGGRPGIVRTIEPLLGERELRLVVQLWREEIDA